jgi:UDP-GlcNAc:undecaprenyl-phosphate GlcNAc-1-phosphate transferase
MELILYFFNSLLIYFLFSKSDFIGNKLKLIDNPDFIRKKHLRPTPVIGGLVLFFLLIFLSISNSDKFYNFFFINNFQKTIEKLSFVLVITTFFLFGLVDDKYNLRPVTKIIGCIAILLFLFTINSNFIIKNVKLSFYKEIDLFQFSILFAMFVFIFFYNAINMFDGINLQSSSLFLVVWIYIGTKFGFNQLIINIIIFLLIFSYFNFKGKTFFGNSGICLMSILIYLYFVKIYNFSNKEFYLDEIFCLFFLPFIDFFRVIFVRFKNNLNILSADTNHIQHVLNKRFNYYAIICIIILGNLLPIVLYNFLKINFGLLVLLFLIFYFYLLYLNSQKKNNLF